MKPQLFVPSNRWRMGNQGKLKLVTNVRNPAGALARQLTRNARRRRRKATSSCQQNKNQPKTHGCEFTRRRAGVEIDASRWRKPSILQHVSGPWRQQQLSEGLVDGNKNSSPGN